MQINYVNAVVERDPMSHIPVCVLATEIPILQMVHGGKISSIEVSEQVAEIEPDDEFERLVNAYRQREGTGRSFAEEVYGSARGIVMQMDSLRAPAVDESAPVRGSRNVSAVKASATDDGA